MNFDPKSFERLKKLGRQLPKELPNPKAKNKTSSDFKRKLHPIETEQNPDQLFRELIEASTDGTIPPHLLNRLKEIEKRNESKNIEFNSHNKLPSNSSTLKTNNEQDNLYTLFSQLLLEEEL